MSTYADTIEYSGSMASVKKSRLNRFARIFFTAAVFIISLIVILSSGLHHSELFDILNIFIALICSVSLFSYQSRPYSLYKILHIFVLFFFCIAPSIQFKNDVRFFDTRFFEEDYLLTSGYVFVILLLYNAIYIIFDKKIKFEDYKYHRNVEYKRISLSQEILFLSISSIICLLFLYINKFNIYSLLFRGGEFVNRIEISQITFLITDFFLRPMVMILFMTACILRVKHKIVLFLLGLLMVVCAPPTGMARFAAAALYIPVIVWFAPILRKRNVFVVFFIFGLLVVFPFIDVFRTNSEQAITSVLQFSQFKELHFDSYSMFMRVLKDNIITDGRQLLGVFLFWVPRTIWIDKPLGSGHFVAEIQDLYFSNLSMPYFSEGFVNFGNIGVFVFVTIIAYFTARTDKKYWIIIEKQKMDVRRIIYLMTLGLFFLVLRGDLMSSFAYLCGFILSYKTIYLLVRKNIVNM